MPEQVVKSKLVIDMAPEEVRKLDEYARAASKAADAQDKLNQSAENARRNSSVAMAFARTLPEGMHPGSRPRSSGMYPGWRPAGPHWRPPDPNESTASPEAMAFARTVPGYTPPVPPPAPGPAQSWGQWARAFPAHAVAGAANGLGGLGLNPASLGFASAFAGLHTGAGINRGMASSDVVAMYGGTRGEQTRAFMGQSQVGRFGLDIADSVTGRGAKMEIIEREKTMRDAVRQTEEQGRQMTRQHEMRRTELTAERMAASVHKGEVARLGEYDRRTVGGETAYREDLQMQPARAAEIEARERQTAAQMETTLYEGQGHREDQRIKALSEQMARANKAKLEAPEGAAKNAAIDEYKRTAEQLKTAEEERLQLSQRINESRMKEVGATKAVKDAQVEILKVQQSQLQAREQTAAGQAKNLGMMTQYDRSLGVQAAQMAKAGEWESMSPEMRQRAASVAPQTVGKIAEAAGADSAEGKQLREMFPDEYRDNLADVRKELGKINEKIQIEIKVNAEDAKRGAEEAFTKEMEKTIEAFTQRQVALVAAMITAAFQRAQTK